MSRRFTCTECDFRSKALCTVQTFALFFYLSEHRFYVTSTSGDSIHSGSTQPTASSPEVKVGSPSDPADLINFSESPDIKEETEGMLTYQTGTEKECVISIFMSDV